MKILLAEDDRVFQIMLRNTLRVWGYEVVVVGDGEAAWQQLNSRGGPRLAILDWVMPGADGLEVCQRVRSGELPHYVYIILLTSKKDPTDLAAGLEAGADDYLGKPVDLNELSLRIRAGCRVLESEERHRVITETASDGIVTMERDNRIHYANSAAGMIFGYPAADLIGQKFSRLAPGFDGYLVGAGRRPAFSDVSEHLRFWPSIEIAGQHRSGRELILEISFSESRDSFHKSVVSAMIRDVTERRRLESQRAQTQKLESIGQLAAGMAHEINTPIQYIGDNLRFIAESYAGVRELVQAYRDVDTAFRAGEDIRALVAKAESAARRIDYAYLECETPCAIEQALEGVERVAEIVKAMREFSHPGSAELAPTDLNRVIEATALISKNKWKWVADLETRLDSELPPVACVAGELSQVFLNLIVNAADAIGDAFKTGTPQKGTIWITSRRDGDFAEVRVRDSGTGIPPAVRPKIFDPFFTTKDVGQGSGQGLAISYAIVVQKHQGTIEFETAVGVGTTFIIRLPIRRPEEFKAISEDSYDTNGQAAPPGWASRDSAGDERNIGVTVGHARHI
jgi:PAS domain S-box-containing protein